MTVGSVTLQWFALTVEMFVSDELTVALYLHMSLYTLKDMKPSGEFVTEFIWSW